jgi:hypothetical protein
MSDYLDQLTSYWKEKKVETAADKATTAEIEAWELRYNVVLPTDLREYVKRVNGIRGGEHLEFDHDCISFLPLSAMCPEEQWSKYAPPSNMFVFADCLIQCYWWCAALDSLPRECTPIYLGGGLPGQYHLAAKSLAEFFNIYMNDPRRLHLDFSKGSRG